MNDLNYYSSQYTSCADILQVLRYFFKKLVNPHEYTVPLKCKLPPSRETRLVSLETSLVSLEKFLVSHECTVSTNALPSGECTNGTILILFCAHLQCIHVGIAFVLL